MSDIKQDFPIFKNNPNLVYLDTTASAQKPQVVIEAMQEMMEKEYANVHRGLYPLSESATEKYEAARETVKQFLHARSPKEIIFTKNATEAINLVAYAWALDNIHQGDVMVVTEMEHHSNLLPWMMVAEKVGAKLVTCAVEHESYKLQIARSKEITNTNNQNAMSSLNEIVDLYGDRVKLVAVTHVSNVLGVVNPIKEIVQLARKVNAKVLVDGCQAVAHLPVDVVDADVDFYVFSGHKLYGPTGIGVLYAKRDLLEYMHPFVLGGEMVLDVGASGKKSVWKELPWKFEAGTPPIVEAIGLKAAIEFITEVGFEGIVKHEQELVGYMLAQLQTVPNLKLIGPTTSEGRIGVFSFVVDGIHPHDLAYGLGEKEVCIRAGHHCAQPLHKELGLNATARASLGLYSNKSDIDTFVKSLCEVISSFGS